MGYVPPPLAPWMLTIEQQTNALVPDLRHRRSCLPWRRNRAARAVQRLIELREHDIYGHHSILHASVCARGCDSCGLKPPPSPYRRLPASYRA